MALWGTLLGTVANFVVPGSGAVVAGLVNSFGADDGWSARVKLRGQTTAVQFLTMYLNQSASNMNDINQYAELAGVKAPALKARNEGTTGVNDYNELIQTKEGRDAVRRYNAIIDANRGVVGDDRFPDPPAEGSSVGSGLSSLFSSQGASSPTGTASVGNGIGLFLLLGAGVAAAVYFIGGKKKKRRY